jgi:hypothetical protein
MLFGIQQVTPICALTKWQVNVSFLRSEKQRGLGSKVMLCGETEDCRAHWATRVSECFSADCMQTVGKYKLFLV